MFPSLNKQQNNGDNQVQSDQQISIRQKIKELKKLRNKIHKLHRKKKQNINNIKHQKFRKYLPVHEKVRDITSGNTKNITIQCTQQKQYFNDEELVLLIQEEEGQRLSGGQQNLGEKIEKIINKQQSKIFKNIAVSNPGINNFWQNVLQNSPYGKYLSTQDRDVLKFVRNIQITESKVNQLSSSLLSQLTSESPKSEVQIQLEIYEGHSILQHGTYKRILVKDSQNQPVRFQGDRIGSNKLRKLKKGLFKVLFSNTKTEYDLNFISQFCIMLEEQIIPYSLEYYLRKQKQIKQDDNLQDAFVSDEGNENIQKLNNPRDYEKTRG